MSYMIKRYTFTTIVRSGVSPTALTTLVHPSSTVKCRTQENYKFQNLALGPATQTALIILSTTTMPVPVISSRYRQRRPSYNTMYLPPYHPSDLSDSINDAVKALNHMNEKSASAWIDIRRMENPFDELMTSELPFRKSIRELAFSADHTANAFERIYTEAEFNGKIRKREEEISHVLGLMQDGVQRSKEVDDLAQQCKQSVKSLEHNRALCEQAQMSGNDIGKGTIFLQIKVGWDNPFEEVTLKVGRPT